ncbi:hypothetical protein VTN49DRAFT_7145 [Thermomyces lanuginosus]|uniref:uncharacterized protein n=1 Tax=Thermomyces lanuginosus TaxID=5541 RepID=UPI0037433D4F
MPPPCESLLVPFLGALQACTPGTADARLRDAHPPHRLIREQTMDKVFGLYAFEECLELCAGIWSVLFFHSQNGRLAGTKDIEERIKGTNGRGARKGARQPNGRAS